MVRISYKSGIPWFIPAAVIFIAVISWDWLDHHGKGLYFAAIGVLIVLSEVRSGLHIRELLTTGAQAQGVVVGAEESTDNDGDIHYHARVRFITRDGRTIDFISGVGYDTEPAVGDPRPVRYRPDDPYQAEVDKASPWILLKGVFLLFGLAFVVAGAFLFFQGSIPFIDVE